MEYKLLIPRSITKPMRRLTVLLSQKYYPFEQRIRLNTDVADEGAVR